MKMLIFDFRDSEKDFFNNNKFIDFEIKFYKEVLDEKTSLNEDEKQNTVILSVFRSSRLSANVLSKFKNLRLIATRSYGIGHIDLEYCKQHNITVINVEYYSEKAIAEYTIALIIDLSRNLLPSMIDLKHYNINYKNYEGKTLKNYTLGIIGCGKVGKTVAKIAHFFGMKVLINSYIKSKDIENIVNYVSLNELLTESDIISLHIPNNEDNYHLISFKEFDKMKNDSFIINTARGELIDIEALYENLTNGKIKGAALDVMECEFLSIHASKISNEIKDNSCNCIKTALITQKLLNMNNVIITPHIGYNTNESINYVLEKTFNNIRDYMKGSKTNRVC